MPLALFGPLGDHSGFYHAIDAEVASLQPSHYEIDHRRRVALTEAGYSEDRVAAAATRIAEGFDDAA